MLTNFLEARKRSRICTLIMLGRKLARGPWAICRNCSQTDWQSGATARNDVNLSDLYSTIRSILKHSGRKQGHTNRFRKKVCWKRKLTHLIFVSKVVVQVAAQFDFLCCDVREVNEKSGAHVFLHVTAVLSGRIATSQQMTILKESTTTNFLGWSGVDEASVQVFQGLLKVAKHAFGNDAGLDLGVQVLYIQQWVQCDLEGVDAELELASHLVHEFQFNTPEKHVRINYSLLFRFHGPIFVYSTFLGHALLASIFDWRKRRERWLYNIEAGFFLRTAHVNSVRPESQMGNFAAATQKCSFMHLLCVRKKKWRCFASSKVQQEFDSQIWKSIKVHQIMGILNSYWNFNAQPFKLNETHLPKSLCNENRDHRSPSLTLTILLM